MLSILLVDDDEIDAEALCRTIANSDISTAVTVAHDGREALERLRGENGHSQVVRPYLILLDLNMPRMDGLEFLNQLRRDPTIADSIVFVLTTSDRDEDKVAAYRHSVAGYIVKNRLSSRFQELASMIDIYSRHIEFPPYP